MRVLLAVKSKKMENLGVMYLSSVAKLAGSDCRIVTFDDAVSVAHFWKPDAIGYSVMTGDQELVTTINHYIKRGWASGLKFPTSIVGGPHATFFPKDFETAEFDYVVHGEAETWLAGLLGSPAIYPSIDSIPWPDRSDFPGMPIRDFITSRGCPFNCAYCYNEQWASATPDRRRVRTRDVDDVVNEVASVCDAKTFVYFQDSCFALGNAWLKEFAHKYKKLVGLPFHCHARPGQINAEYASLLSEAGCYSIRIALETSSDRLRTIINRAHTTDQETIHAARRLKRNKIQLMIQNMLGLPTSTIEDDLATLEVNIRCEPAYGWCSIFQPYPGTELADLCIKNGWYTGDFSEISDSFFDGSVLNFDDEHKERLICLQKIFALAVETKTMPKVEELTMANFPALVHRLTRAQGDRRLYGGVV